MKPQLGDDPGLGQRFVQEARAASGIAHAHVVQITDFGEAEGGGAFIVMEYLEGEDLSTTLQREGPLPWARVVHIAEQIARALAAAHREGIVHRDIKPANCFRVTRDDDHDYIKVLDFGLAKVLGGHSRDHSGLTRTGALLGTPGYIAPELYRGLAADHRVDIYALGALMYKLLTGELPPMKFAADDPSGADHPAIPPPLQAIVRRLLAEDPGRRYATAQAVAADLKALAGKTGVALDPGSDAPSVTSASGPLLAVNREGRRLSFTIAAPLLIALLVGVGVLVYLGVTRDAPSEPGPPQDLQAAAKPPAPAPEPTTVAWNLATKPPGARVEVEGATPEVAAALAPQLEGRVTPLRLAVPRAADTRLTLVFTRDGHYPGRLALAADDDHDVDLELPPAAPTEPVPEASSTGAPADDPTGGAAPVTESRPPGSPAALQRLIAQKCSSLFRYTLKVQWTGGDDGRLVPGSVKPLEPRADLNAEHTCALRQIRRSELAWPPGKTHTHVFAIGG